MGHPNIIEIERKAIELSDIGIILAAGGGTSGVDKEGHKGIWVTIKGGPLFIRKGEHPRQAVKRRETGRKKTGFSGFVSRIKGPRSRQRRRVKLIVEAMDELRKTKGINPKLKKSLTRDLFKYREAKREARKAIFKKIVKTSIAVGAMFLLDKILFGAAVGAGASAGATFAKAGMSKAKAFSSLGLKKGASPTTIKTAFRKSAFKFHPDMNAGSTLAAAKFRKAREAYDILK